MIHTFQLSALIAGNKTTHLYLYLLFNSESSPTVAEILKGQICVIMNQTLASDFSVIIL